ncbi:hypothetical protein B1218_37160 [Pseudomonas ogarae]|nr:hypothetical protein B1218_37160 [Pseudomonas ogarae]
MLAPSRAAALPHRISGDHKILAGANPLAPKRTRASRDINQTQNPMPRLGHRSNKPSRMPL